MCSSLVGTLRGKQSGRGRMRQFLQDPGHQGELVCVDPGELGHQGRGRGRGGGGGLSGAGSRGKRTGESSRHHGESHSAIKKSDL